jgi:Lrp/AsnC family transcriptional regulator for asnA, asnC and gidA
LDAVDQRLVFELSNDGRVSLNTIAEKLEVSETQVRMRIAQMTSKGQMSIMAIVNPMNLENRAIAWLGIKTSPSASSVALADELSAIPQISYIALCSGRYDLFAEIVCPSTEILRDVVDTRVRTRAGSRSVEVFLYLDLHYKRLVPATELR